MNKKVLFMTLTLIFSLIIVGKMMIALTHNFLLKKNFPNVSDAYDYESDMLNDDIDLLSVQIVFPTASALPGLNIDDIANVIKPPVTLRYYHAINDTSPAHVIEKETAIVVKDFMDSSFLPYPQEVGYGLYSLPTKNDEWRLARPFRTGVEAADDEFFYVKMDELSVVSRAWINENKGLVQLGKHVGLSKRQTIEQLPLQVDLQLYDHGIYLSPALLKPILPMFSVFLLALTIITFIAWRIYEKRSL